mmetsp:Transcript_10882/g.15173  ORF Transcript_10882/g.15173 Transcript_10882/m.15173 type:complete len:334 (+) Transcript_10882:169-1170(+)
MRAKFMMIVDIQTSVVMVSKEFIFDCVVAGVCAVGSIYSACMARKVEAIRRATSNNSSPSYNARLLWAVACFLAIGVPGYLLRPRGPIQAPWQFLITTTLLAPAIVKWIGVTFLRALTIAVYTSANLKSVPSENMKKIFDIACYFIAVSTLVSIVASIVTNDRKYEAICFGSLLLTQVLYDPYIIVSLFQLHQNIASHLETLRKPMLEKVSSQTTPRSHEKSNTTHRLQHVASSDYKSNTVSNPFKVDEDVCKIGIGNDTSVMKSSIALVEIESREIFKRQGVRRQTIASRRRDEDIKKFKVLLNKLKFIIFMTSLIVSMAAGLLLIATLTRI